MIWSSAAFSRSGFAPEPPLKQTFGADRASSLALISGWFALLADVGLPKTAQRVNEGASRADSCMVPQRYPMTQDHLVALKMSFYSQWGWMDLGGRFPVTAATSPFSRDGMAVKRGRCPIPVTKAFDEKVQRSSMHRVDSIGLRQRNCARVDIWAVGVRTFRVVRAEHQHDKWAFVKTLCNKCIASLGTS